MRISIYAAFWSTLVNYAHSKVRVIEDLRLLVQPIDTALRKMTVLAVSGRLGLHFNWPLLITWLKNDTVLIPVGEQTFHYCRCSPFVLFDHVSFILRDRKTSDFLSVSVCFDNFCSLNSLHSEHILVSSPLQFNWVSCCYRSQGAKWKRQAILATSGNVDYNFIIGPLFNVVSLIEQS